MSHSHLWRFRIFPPIQKRLFHFSNHENHVSIISSHPSFYSCTGSLSIQCIPFHCFAFVHIPRFFCHCCWCRLISTYSTFCSVRPKLRFHWSEVGKNRMQPAGKKELMKIMRESRHWLRTKGRERDGEMECEKIIWYERCDSLATLITQTNMREMGAKICLHELHHTQQTYKIAWFVHKNLREWNRFTRVQIITCVIFNYCLVCR